MHLVTGSKRRYDSRPIREGVRLNFSGMLSRRHCKWVRTDLRQADLCVRRNRQRYRNPKRQHRVFRQLECPLY
jgi:hypothetical protein